MLVRHKQRNVTVSTRFQHTNSTNLDVQSARLGLKQHKACWQSLGDLLPWACWQSLGVHKSSPVHLLDHSLCTLPRSSCFATACHGAAGSWVTLGFLYDAGAVLQSVINSGSYLGNPNCCMKALPWHASWDVFLCNQPGCWCSSGYPYRLWPPSCCCCLCVCVCMYDNVCVCV
jgi:hypothetical protein